MTSVNTMFRVSYCVGIVDVDKEGSLVPDRPDTLSGLSEEGAGTMSWYLT